MGFHHLLLSICRAEPAVQAGGGGFRRAMAETPLSVMSFTTNASIFAGSYCKALYGHCREATQNAALVVDGGRIG